MSKREKVLTWFIKNSLPPGIKSFDDLSIVAARQTLNVDHTQADKYSNRHRNALWKYFCLQVVMDKKKGLFPVAQIIDKGSRRIESTPSWLNRINRKKALRLSTRLAMRPFVYRHIEDFNDRIYEALCCLVCQKIGAVNVHLTPKGDEGGIDFLAEVESKQGFPKCSGLTKLRIVGQAKKYNKKVPVGDFRDFNDTLADVRRLSPAVKRHLPSWFRESHSPIVGWMVGHKGFQSGCESKAKMNGIMLFNSQALTEAIVMSRQIGAAESGEVVSKRMIASCYEILRTADSN